MPNGTGRITTRMPRPGSRKYPDTRTPQERHRTQQQRRADRRTTFIGVDGEGWTDRDGTHRYAQLSVGSDTIFGWEHLDFTQIMEFLWNCFQADPRAAYVGFFLGYDFSQWLRTLPEERARMLLSKAGISARRRKDSGGNTVPFPVEYNGWEFDCLGTKQFKLRRMGEEHWMVICDVGSFFQASFLSVIDPKGWPDGAPATAAEYDVVLEGKSHRADDWTAESWMAARDDLTRYNVTENIVLSRVMEKYEEGLIGAGVRLNRDRWFGPGQAAQSWMKLQGVSDREWVEKTVPKDVLEFARESYYGGHFEVFVHGIVPGMSYEYDINSAYPFGMSQMFCWIHSEYRWIDGQPESRGSLARLCESLVGGLLGLERSKGQRWLCSFPLDGNRTSGDSLCSLVLQGTKSAGGNDGGSSLCECRMCESRAFADCDRVRESTITSCSHTGQESAWLIDCTTIGSDPVMGSQNHRRPNGTIARPHRTRGVRWAHEVAAGVAAGTIDTVEIHQCLEIIPRECGCTALSSGIPEIYQKRLDVGKNTAHGKAFKLIYNSAYGKQAQSIGSPKFSNPLSASFITSHCRTMILKAIASHPNGTKDLLMVATDGVYFRSPHTSLDISPSELGKWDLTEKPNLTIVMPGVHYDDNGRAAAAEGKYAKLKSRGISAAGLATSIAALDTGFRRLVADPGDLVAWPVLDIPIKFQVASPVQSLAQGKWDRAGTVARDVERKLSTDPSSKRVGPTAEGLWPTGREPYVEDGIVRTWPYEIIGDGQSAPYSERFGMAETDMGMSPDGDLLSEFWSVVRDE
jgi:hypothetical protein